MASETKSGVVKMKSINQEGSSSSSVIRKKIESSAKPVVDSKPKIVSSVVKSEVKSKTTSGSGSSKVTAKKTTSSTKKKTTTTKKVYTLAGQRYDPPEEREPLRIFYESLSKQIPTSEMAEFWMMEHGMLSPDRAKRAYEKKQRRQKQIRSGTTPIKSPKPTSRPESSYRPQPQPSKNGDVKPKKRIVNDSDDDDDFILSPKRRKV